jgi:hypothetical protein
MELKWGKEDYTLCYTRNDVSGLALCKTGIWKLREEDTVSVDRKKMSNIYN